MEMPQELWSLIANLTPDDSDELTDVISHLPADDDEMQALILENLDSLIQAVSVGS